MLTIHFPSFPTLQTPRLLLREVVPDDAAAVFKLRTDERVMRYLGRPLHTDISQSAQLIEAYREGFAQNEGVTWAICLREQPEFIGSITFWKIDKVNHRAEIGYTLSADYWRQGIMDEAMTAVLEYGFKTLHFHSIEANTAPENEASGGILEKHGFVEEAYFRENFYFNGEFLDSRIYSKINPYHPPRRTNS